MADTDFDAYTDVSPALSTDKLLAWRSGAGVNFTLATLAGYVNAAAGDGTVSLPGMAFASDVDTGFYRPSANNLAAATAGVERLRIDASGRMFHNHNAVMPILGGSGYQFVSHSITTTGLIAAQWYNALGAGGELVMARSRGASVGAFAAVANGDDIGRIRWASDDGTNLNTESARISVVASATPTTGVVPATMNFYTMNAAGTLGLRLQIDASQHILPGADNTQNLGSASKRVKEFFAGTGTINTSDAREKAWRGGLNETQIRAGRRIIRELGWYQWLADVERKGEHAARLHFGVRAQAVIRILIEEGIEQAQDIDLPADQFIPEGARPSFRSAFLCFDTWEDEWQDEYEMVTRIEQRPVATASASILGRDGAAAQHVDYEDVEIEERVPTGAQILTRPAGNRFGLRTDQLTLFLIAVQDAVQEGIEARLAAMEAA